MAEITFNFSPEMEEALLTGRKLCTTRHSRHGVRGDTFKVRGIEFKILSIYKTTLRKAIDEFYEIDGFMSPSEMFNFWVKTYRVSNVYDFTKKYHNQAVFVHFVARCGGNT